MISPADMNIIQIDITNDCFNRCANCSRFSGNHKDVYYMNWDTFRRACESFQVKKFKGMVVIIGGEPTLHPEFDRFIRYYDNVIPHGFDILNMNSPNVNEPIDDICKYQFDNWNLKDWQRRGLWTSLGPGYAKHFELIYFENEAL
jgi:MoaA/NifB/PqqE/SkfB family radical SAM enzyme